MIHFLNFEFWLSLATLTFLEVILNADNIVFIVTASSRLPRKQQAFARKLGLFVAALSRILFLSVLFYATTLTKPFYYIGSYALTINNLVLILGGLFLIINPALDLRSHQADKEKGKRKTFANFTAVIIQIMFVDIVFSIDNVVTAIGVAKTLLPMIIAIILAMMIMVMASNILSRIIDAYPPIKIIGLCYLMWIGGVLVLRGLNIEVSGGYIYLPLAFVTFTQAMIRFTRS